MIGRTEETHGGHEETHGGQEETHIGHEETHGGQEETHGGHKETHLGQDETHGGHKETHGGHKETGRRAGPSFTTLSTIAVQAGQSLIVVSVLKSGSLVHLQLVQVHPGLCEIGSNQEENQILIQEQQQLLVKLKKHEREVLSVVERTERRKQRRSRKQEEDVHRAMTGSLKEGWSLLLRLLERRQEVLTLTSEFYCRAMEFAAIINRLEDLQISTDEDRLREVQLTYESTRRDLLGKSLQVITSSNSLLKKLRHLQRTEALQRRGGVLHEEEEEEEVKAFERSRGAVLRLEELVETLQDRRRRADQDTMQQLQQAEKLIMIHEEERERSREATFEDWRLTVDEILDQNQQSEPKSSGGPDLRTESRTKETIDLKSVPPSEEESGVCRPDLTRDQEPGSRSDLQSGSRSGLPNELGSEETRVLKPVSKTGATTPPPNRSRSDLLLEFRSEETKTSKPGVGSDLKQGSRLHLKPEQTKDLLSISTSAQKSGLESDLRTGLKLKPKSGPEESRNPPPCFKLNLKAGPASDQISGSGSNLQPETRLDVKPPSTLESTKDLEPGSRLKEIKTLKFGIRLNLNSGSRSDLQSSPKQEDTRDLELKTPDLNYESRSDLKPASVLFTHTRDLVPGLKVNLKTQSRSDSKSEATDVDSLVWSEKTKNFETRFQPDGKPESKSHLKPGPSSKETKDQQDLTTESQSESSLVLKSGSKPEETKDLPPRSGSDLQSEFRSQETRNIDLEPRQEGQLGSRSGQEPGHGRKETRNLQHGSRSEETEDLQSETGQEAEDVHLSELNLKLKETQQKRAATTVSRRDARQESMLGKETEIAEDHAHIAILTNQRQQLLSSCEHLLDKVWSWLQQGSSVLSDSSEVGQRLCEAEHTLNKHLQLHAQAESAGHDAGNMKQILDQIKALHTHSTSRTSPRPRCEPSGHPSPLKVMTEQLKTGSAGRANTTQPGLPADLTPSFSPELTDRVHQVLKELQSLDRKIDSNLQLLRPYVSFLRTAQQVEEEMEIYRSSPEEEKKQKRPDSCNITISNTSSSAVKKKQADASWQETLQRVLMCQELGNNLVNSVSKVSGVVLNVKVVVSEVQQTMERLSKTKQEVNKLLTQQQNDTMLQQEYCRKHQERFLKTLQDLKCVSELLDSCTQMDLGSDLQTSRLLEHFTQAGPHFKQLDAEVEFTLKSWETLRQVRPEVTELGGPSVREEDLSELLKLHERVKNKIRYSETILDLTRSFHLKSKQLDVLLQSDPESSFTGFSGLCGSIEAEMSLQRQKQQQIQNLLTNVSTLKTDICTDVNQKGGFRVEQLEARLLSLDSLCVSSLNEARQCEQNQLLTRQLNNDIIQLRDSFKELKKRFSNLKFNYMKRNDRTRNTKAARNQLQQVEMYEEKLQVLRKRLQGVTARLGTEVKDGGVAREAEDAINELQRQMGEFERGVSEHQKTLEMTCKLQQAMEEYQFWCEEASATIARVRTFSSECRSTEAVTVLYQQFEKFVWPTVPQQEERISQISELAVRLHGAEEGQRYIEKTVSKHSEMVASIRELSDGLLELEAKLKKENKQQEEEEAEKEKKEEDERRDSMTEEKDVEKEKKGNRKLKKKEQRNNRSTQEMAEMYELKETGHTPELTAEHDGKEVPLKRQTAANRKPPLQKSQSQEAETQTVISENSRQHTSSSFCSTHTLSLSCSPVLANRRIYTIHSQSQPGETETTSPLPLIGPSFSDIQRAFQRKETAELRQQNASARGLSETELQQQEVMIEDYLSNDEYECASPDDISLPPLAETPESIMVQSDVEEGVCFSSHSVHINQYSHQYHAQSEQIGSSSACGAVQQRGPSCRTPPSNPHSSTRLRSESGLLVQSVLTVPASSPLTSTLCSILITKENSIANVPQSADHPLGAHEPSLLSGSNPVQNSSTADTCSDTDNKVPEINIPLQIGPQINKHKIEFNQPQTTTGTQGKITPNIGSKGETSLKTDPFPQTAVLSHGPISPLLRFYPLHSNELNPDLQRDKTLPQDTRILKSCTTFSQKKTSICQEKSFTHSFPASGMGLHQDTASSQTEKEAYPVSTPKRTLESKNSTSINTIYSQSSTSNSTSTSTTACSSPRSSKERPESKTLSKTEPVLSCSYSALYKDSNLPGDIKSSETCVHTSTTLSRDSNRPQSSPDSRSNIDQDVLYSQSSKETSSLSMPLSRSPITSTPVIQQTFHSQSFPQGSYCNIPEVHDAIIPQPNCVSNISTSLSTITSTNRFSSEQSHKAVHSICGSTCTQQCVHGPGMTPGSPAEPAAPSQPKAHTLALAQQANPHATPLSFPPHLLTPDQDPNICQPMAIREEIKLTPQIQGPPLPAPHPLPESLAESLPQGKASKPGPPCFTRPLSRATVMEGSPVTLEVEVSGHPEPALTWSKEQESSGTGPGRALALEDGEHFQYIPEASYSEEESYEAHAAKHLESEQSAGISSSCDKWLVTEVFEIMSVDWHTWFGTLCVLLWLLYLILL
ncbi:trichohyalin [Labrus mixtus]|uniref:trichohyalin n=1 Tax=Labrus mixtus TaxID=508554 RepID=UPI0029C065E7|nr:trichohyalin [Labrus mixtus]